MLRQVARYGMQGWAYASGALPATHTSLMWPGAVSGGEVVLAADNDATPGSTMQSEGGMKGASS
jgi:hypothetical protein